MRTEITRGVKKPIPRVNLPQDHPHVSGYGRPLELFYLFWRGKKKANRIHICRLVWEFFCQVVFWFVAVPCLERKGRSSSRRLRSGSRSARKGVKGPKC